MWIRSRPIPSASTTDDGKWSILRRLGPTRGSDLAAITVEGIDFSLCEVRPSRAAHRRMAVAVGNPSALAAIRHGRISRPPAATSAAPTITSRLTRRSIAAIPARPSTTDGNVMVIHTAIFCALGLSSASASTSPPEPPDVIAQLKAWPCPTPACARLADPR